ncbi:hypothetical protein TELCIR_26081 [Teladorsagia circumcincta]|uniref:Tyrosine-protein phosphatase domain-containing protein n=1 Tax=Teladorsagia circumcincta TaxID=45464 RepID=A0A2G9T3U8_TELCI|nr:hypothetical protein TELCIR_26081 [Teladorsagia circumcincta]
MNNSSNLSSPLAILRLARNSSRPVIIHDCLGISRAACVVATELAICNIIKGPTYKKFFSKISGQVRGMEEDYQKEAPDCVGELPIPLNPTSVLSHARRSLVT